MATVQTKDKPMDIDSRLTLLRTEYMHSKHQAQVTIAPDDRGETAEWIVRKEIKLSGAKYLPGSKVTLPTSEAERLYRHGFLIAPEVFEANQVATKARKFLMNEVAPIEAVYRQAKRYENEALDHVADLEHQLAQARQAVEATKAQRESVERQLNALLDQVI